MRNLPGPVIRNRLVAAVLAAVLLLGGCRASVTGGPAVVQAPPTPAVEVVRLQNRPDSFKFAVLGDFGTGEPAQYELAAQMLKTHERFPYEVVILVGDNLYGSERPQDFLSARCPRPGRPAGGRRRRG